ncbi:sigma-54-dependent Fis family transcriptional regulator [Nitrospira defluvii]|nr:sigma-54-dependent Fis family transcriptional regulator [Nitrospira defluvii]
MGAKHIKPILIVDDDPSIRGALSASLKQKGYSVLLASNGEDALQICKTHVEKDGIGLILSDVKMPEMNGIDFFNRAKTYWPEIPVVMMSAFGTIQEAVGAMKIGIFDYLAKPFSDEDLENVIRHAFSHKNDEKVTAHRKEKRIITQDPGMKQLLKMAEVVASSQATVLIEAESGTGKELLARFIHDHSTRAHRPFVAINCAAVPDTLLESELFGYEKGAFTGAATKKPGRFELAQKGTLLLDEVSEMQLSLQAKLLRVLQEREVDVLGGKEPLAIDIRVIATTNRSLLGEVKAGRFREDLYYRLNVFPLRIPPLRERMGDIPLLVEHFIKKGALKNGRSVTSIDPEALKVLEHQSWKGNIREFENMIERAILLTEGEIITPDHLLFSESILEKRNSESHVKTIWEAERNLILETLAQVSSNRTHAARMLGISIRTLRNKLREYHRLDPECETTI